MKYTVIAILKNGMKVLTKVSAKSADEAEVMGNRVILDKGIKSDDVVSVTVE